MNTSGPRTRHPAVKANPSSVGGFTVQCPSCGHTLMKEGAGAWTCHNDGQHFEQTDGIWDFLPSPREDYFSQFLNDYQTIRREEGRGDDNPSYYRALPFRDTTGEYSSDWSIRATSYRTMLSEVVAPLEGKINEPLAILDLGAGNGWLANRLSRRGHRVVAVDVQTDELDGLGAHRHYRADFLSLRADFHQLPLAGEQFDLAVFNSALHYATDYEAALTEALRVLGPDGVLTVLDSPIYTDPVSGEQMVQERQQLFIDKYGFPSDGIPSEDYLTLERWNELCTGLGLHSHRFEPFYNWRWELRPWYAWLRGYRQPARFMVLAAQIEGARWFRSERSVQRTMIRGWQKVRSRARHLWFRLFESHRHRCRIVEEIGGQAFVVPPDVFNPRLLNTGAFLAESLERVSVSVRTRVLDLGCGTGVGAIAAARWSADVTAIDVNGSAVECTITNASVNDVSNRVTVYQGDLFSPVDDERFDLILFNPPFFEGTPVDDYDRAWKTPDVLQRFAQQVSGHLTDGGYALVVYSSHGNLPRLLHLFWGAGLQQKIVARQSHWGETLYLIRITRTRRS